MSCVVGKAVFMYPSNHRNGFMAIMMLFPLVFFMLRTVTMLSWNVMVWFDYHTPLPFGVV